MFKTSCLLDAAGKMEVQQDALWETATKARRRTLKGGVSGAFHVAGIEMLWLYFKATVHWSPRATVKAACGSWSLCVHNQEESAESPLGQ